MLFVCEKFFWKKSKKFIQEMIHEIIILEFNINYKWLKELSLHILLRKKLLFLNCIIFYYETKSTFKCVIVLMYYLFLRFFIFFYKEDKHL
jgi:hypothetical protein